MKLQLIQTKNDKNEVNSLTLDHSGLRVARDVFGGLAWTCLRSARGDRLSDKVFSNRSFQRRRASALCGGEKRMNSGELPVDMGGCGGCWRWGVRAEGGSGVVARFICIVSQDQVLYIPLPGVSKPFPLS